MSFPALSSNVFNRDDLAAHIYAANNKGGFIAAQVAPPLAVDKATGTLMVVGASTGMGLEDTERAENGAYPEISGELTSASYETEDHGCVFPVGAVRAKQYASQIEMDMAASAAAFGVVARKYEYATFATIYAAVSGNAAAIAWDSYSTAQPAFDVSIEAAVIAATHGFAKTELTLALPRQIAEKLPFVADVRARLQIQTAPFAGSLTAQQLAEYFGVGEVLIGGAVYNSAAEGQTASLSYCHPTDKCLLFKKSTGNVADTAGFARTAVWDDNMSYEELQSRVDAGGLPVILDQWWDAKHRTMNYRARNYRGLFTMLTTAARKVTGID